jgi:DNA-directed RNA polymerase subunit beta'
VPFDDWSTAADQEGNQTVIDTVYRHCGQKETVIFCDRIMALGFREACRPASRSARTTWSSPTPREARRRNRKQVKEFEQQYQDGLITQGEKYNKVVDAWSKCTDKVAEEMMPASRPSLRRDNGVRRRSTRST